MEQSNKPGCFGSPLCWHEESPLCKTCVFANECQPAARERAQRLSAKYGIKSLLTRKPASRPATPKTTPAIATKPQQSAPKKAVPPTKDHLINMATVRTIQRLKGAGVDLADSIRKGTNPLATQPDDFMGVAIDLLLKGGCTAYDLTNRLQVTHDYSAQIAELHASVAIRTLIRTGAAQRDNDTWALVPNIETELEVLV